MVDYGVFKKRRNQRPLPPIRRRRSLWVAGAVHHPLHLLFAHERTRWNEVTAPTRIYQNLLNRRPVWSTMQLATPVKTECQARPIRRGRRRMTKCVIQLFTLTATPQKTHLTSNALTRTHAHIHTSWSIFVYSYHAHILITINIYI